jgi:iron complex outermembrane receptor protein
MKTHNSIRNAVRYALTAGVAASLGAPAVLAQQAQDEEARELDRVQVTGSRISRLDVEGPSPVTIISREDLDLSGDISVSDVLRNLSSNSFGSFRERSGVAGGGVSKAAVDLRGLGSGRTLVLINGRRMAANAGLGGGDIQNTNLIPFAAVERIEVLRDGASAIYGADAVGGVVNIILRDDYEGFEVTAGHSSPTQSGTPSEDTLSVTLGTAGERGNIVVTLDHQHRDMMFNRARDWAAVGLSAFGFPGSFDAFDPDTGDYEFTSYDARCPEELGDSRFPNSRVDGSLCVFNYAATSANEASLTRDSLMVNANYQVSDNIDFFTRAIVSHTDSFGVYAATPVVGGVPAFPSMSADNPLNPTADADRFPDGPYDLDVIYRNTPTGTRDTVVNDQLMDVAMGFSGFADLFGGTDWEVGVQHSRNREFDYSFNLSFRSKLQDEIDSGGIDIFQMGTWADNDEYDAALDEAAQRIRHDGFTKNENVFRGIDANISFDIFQLRAGAVPLVLGFEHMDFKYDQQYDAASNQGDVDGSAGGDNVTAYRDNLALFFETEIPVTDMFSINVAGRHDDYSDFGTAFSPKISFQFRPMDSLLLRGTWGEGFKAPSMTQVYGGQSATNLNAIDSLLCDVQEGRITFGDAVNATPPWDPCVARQYFSLVGGNEFLEAEDSDSWTAGAVWSPSENFNLGISYYNINMENVVAAPGQQFTFNEERDIYVAEGGGCWPLCLDEPGYLLQRAAHGGAELLRRQNRNLAERRTRGVDLDFNWRFLRGTAYGDFGLSGDFTYVDKFETRASPGANWSSILDTTGFPDWRGQVALNWGMGEWSAYLRARYVGESGIITPTGADARLDDWLVFDVQASWEAPWNGRVTVGARNLTNEDPPISTTHLPHPFYDNTLHDVYGRVPYVRYTQRF